MNTTNYSSFGLKLYTVKASFYLLDFLICSVFTVLITHTVWRDNVLKNEVRFFFLCHHLICLTLFFGLGTITTYLRALQVNAPILVCWIIFALQIIIGRAVLLTLTLMALNTCIAVCWPLKYFGIAHFFKSKLIVCLWIIAFLDPMVSLIYGSIQGGHQFIRRKTCWTFYNIQPPSKKDHLDSRTTACTTHPSNTDEHLDRWEN
ncbi:hypothetical protein GDO81_008643 [Engystomops pustulosus]|uniref:G-protein coupled receptors family 1 profile domain-containing protein n=1 Tax=Engystomops pustulosus TaxID=76066 RepID=A0AAV7CGE6_ENGPU|nr:hypothetical protein GDO81_008643 [Engystomops pustulosus]